jgi:hypothetical protein
MARVRLKEDYITKDGFSFKAGLVGTTRCEVNKDGMRFVTWDGHRAMSMDADKEKVKAFVGFFPVELLVRIDMV